MSDFSSDADPEVAIVSAVFQFDAVAKSLRAALVQISELLVESPSATSRPMSHLVGSRLARCSICGALSATVLQAFAKVSLRTVTSPLSCGRTSCLCFLIGCSSRRCSSGGRFQLDESQLVPGSQSPASRLNGSQYVIVGLPLFGQNLSQE
jgi:hypothetical protein